MCDMNYAIIFQHPIALVNDLICRGGIEDATCARSVGMLRGYVCALQCSYMIWPMLYSVPGILIMSAILIVFTDLFVYR